MTTLADVLPKLDDVATQSMLISAQKLGDKIRAACAAGELYCHFPAAQLACLQSALELDGYIVDLVVNPQGNMGRVTWVQVTLPKWVDPNAAPAP